MTKKLPKRTIIAGCDDKQAKVTITDQKTLRLLDKIVNFVPAPPVNYRPMVQVNGNEWCGNALVFATREEAEANARALMWNWTAVTDTRVDETDAPVNYRWVDGKLEDVANG